MWASCHYSFFMEKTPNKSQAEKLSPKWQKSKSAILLGSYGCVLGLFFIMIFAGAFVLIFQNLDEAQKQQNNDNFRKNRK